MTTLTVNLLDSTSVETALRVLLAVEERGDLTPYANTPEAEVVTEPTPTPEPEAAADDDQPDPSVPDIHGLIWDDAIHSSPPRHNADGSWRMKRGKKDEYEAAIAAANKPEPMPTGDAPMPAAPEPTAPQPLIEYEAMSKRFIAMMDSGKIGDFQAVYVALGIDYAGLQTNQTMIDRLWHYMDALDEGEAHDGAVRHAMGS